MGGLGNQIFQYAAGYLQQKITNGRLYFTKAPNPHDTTDYRTTFGLEKYDTELPPHRVDLFQDSFASWNPMDYNYTVIFIKGNFQNYSVLKPILPEFKDILLEKLKSQREIILHKYTILPSSGFLHIRRGDYLGLSDRHHIQDLDYYSSALHTMRDIKNWFIFSDDLNWVKEQALFQELHATFVEESEPLMAVALMSEIHDGAIIANSSFSWWGAYLGVGEQNVVYPTRWLNNSTPDLFPEKWIGI